MEKQLHILLCDDDEVSLKVSKALVQVYSKKYKKNVCIHEFRGFSKELKQLIATECIDIAFLDIDLKEDNGIEIAKELQKGMPEIPIVFVTSHGEYRASAWEIMAFGYIPKPIVNQKFGLVYKRAILQAEGLKAGKADKFLFITSDNTEIKLFIPEIISIEKVHRTTRIMVKDKVWETNETIRILEEKLPSYFLRINQRVLINTNKIQYVDGKKVYVAGGTYFNIGIKYWKKAVNQLK